MQQLSFAVSAKTARLLGRENISGVDGAVVELIKNSYDADASCVFVLFDVPFNNTPQVLSYDIINTVFEKSEISKLLEYYSDSDEGFKKKDNLSANQEEELLRYLFTKNTITVIDNGCGMTEETLKTAWMNIGTNDKADNRTSPKGRIKTGAKGIGRFALDKLSRSTVVYTKSSSDSLKKWQINWDQFETASLISDVTATIEDAVSN